MRRIPPWMWAFFFLLGAAAGVGTGLALWYSPNSATARLPESTAIPGIQLTAAPAPVTGAPAPDFALIGLDDATTQLSGLRGTPVIINFWATWCEPCKEELPLLEQAAQAHSELHVLAIASAEGENDVRAFVQALQLPDLSVLLDPTGAVRDQYLILGYPTTFFIDRDGIIREKKVGTYDAATLAAILQNLGVNP